jgi:hypothetical protein
MAYTLHVLPYCLLGLLSAVIAPAPALRADTGQTPRPAVPVSIRPQFAIGDTVYVATRFLNVRSSPHADGPGDPNSYVGRNYKGTVVALPNRNWALVLFMSGDVGIRGYVSQWYLAKEKTKADN